MLLLLLLLAGTLGLSFVCSILEAVILSITPSYVEALKTSKPKIGTLIQRLKNDPDRPLSAILALNTIANTAGATAVGAQAFKIFGSPSVASVSAVLTLLVLFFSEIIPKTIGATYWRSLSIPTARIINTLIIILFPFVLVGSFFRTLISRGRKALRVSEEEIRAMADLGREEGVFQDSESRVLKNVIRFGSLKVRGIMTPRTVVVAFPETTKVSEIMKAELGLRFSRIPIFKGNIDNVTGYVLKSDLLLAAAQGSHNKPLLSLNREISVVPDTQSLRDLFAYFLDKRDKITILVDQYGGMAGIVTMEDVVEALLGLEIVDESDTDIDMQKLARSRWEKRALKMGIEQESPQELNSLTSKR